MEEVEASSNLRTVSTEGRAAKESQRKKKKKRVAGRKWWEKEKMQGGTELVRQVEDPHWSPAPGADWLPVPRQAPHPSRALFPQPHHEGHQNHTL